MKNKGKVNLMYEEERFPRRMLLLLLFQMFLAPTIMRYIVRKEGIFIKV